MNNKYVQLKKLHILKNLEIAVTYQHLLLVPEQFCGIWGECLVDSSGFHYYFINTQEPHEIFKVSDYRRRDQPDMADHAYWPWIVHMFLHPDYDVTTDPDEVTFEFCDWLRRTLVVKR